MREHRYSFEMPHSAARVWALFQDYERWTDDAPMVRRVDVLFPGDEHHNGRLRRVVFKLPFGREGSEQRGLDATGVDVAHDASRVPRRPRRPSGRREVRMSTVARVHR